MTGVLVRGENIFWNIFISIAVVISGISMASLTLKQLVESFRDHRILHKVCIMAIRVVEFSIGGYKVKKVFA